MTKVSSLSKNQTASRKKSKKSRAVTNVSTKSKDLYPMKDLTKKSPVSTECLKINNCSECKVYVQMTEEPEIPYTILLRKMITEQNILLFKNVAIIALSFLASLTNFTRVSNFPLKQLYLENVFAGLTYYLYFTTLCDTFVILLGGHFLWYIAFTTKSKELTILLMTFLQFKNFSFICYSWFAAFFHLLSACVLIFYTTVRKTHYVTAMIYCLTGVYFKQIFRNGVFYLEDLCYLLVMIVLAWFYTHTEDVNDCFAHESLGMSVMFILAKYVKTHYSW